MFLYVRRRGEVSRRPCMLINVCLAPCRGVCEARCGDHFDSRCHFACSSFAMHRHLTAAPPVRTVRETMALATACSCVFGCVLHQMEESCGACHTVAVFLLSVISAFSRRPGYYWVDARRALDQQWTAPKPEDNRGKICWTTREVKHFVSFIEPLSVGLCFNIL